MKRESNGNKSGLILVIVLGLCLVTLFGVLIPVILGKVATTYRGYKALADVHKELQRNINLKKGPITDKVVADKKPTPSKSEEKPLFKSKNPAMEDKWEKKTAHPPSGSSQETEKGISTSKEGKTPPREALRPSSVPQVEEKGKGKEVVMTEPQPPEARIGQKEPALPPKVEQKIEKEASLPLRVETKAETKADAPQPLPAVPEVAFVVPRVDPGPARKGTGTTEVPEKKRSLYAELSRTVDLKKGYKGVFPVELRLSGSDGKGVRPQLSYWVGTGEATGYIDMQAIEGDLWRYEIPDQGWANHRSQVLFYKIRVVDGEGDVLMEGDAQRELIDSFDENSLASGR
jgi:hypothetical protein